MVDKEQQALLGWFCIVVICMSHEYYSVYQDESSDELEDAIDDLLVPGSDTDDDWEEEGDAEMEGGDDSDDSVEIVNGENGDDNMDSDTD